MEVNWKNVGLGIAGLGGLGYLAYKYYNAKEEEKEEYAFKRAQRAKKHAKEEAKQELLQERLIEEIEAPFARYCADMGGFSFGAGFLELKAKMEQASQESGKVDSSFSGEAGMDCHEFDKSNSRNDEKYAIDEKVDSSTAETLSSSQAEGFADEASSDTNAGGRIGEKVDSSTAETLSELAQDSRICDEKSGLSSDWQGIYLSGNDRRQSRRIHDLSRKAESTRNAKLSQKMREINAYITSFSPTQDELLKVLSLGQEMFDRVSKAKPFAQFIQASKSSGETTQEAESEQNTPSDRAKELISLYAAVIISLSGDERDDLWGSSDCISQWRHQWLFNTGLTLPLQVCMMKHLQGVFGIEPANFTAAVSKLAKAAAHKYRIIGLDDDKDDEPKTHISSVSGFIPVFIKIHQQTPRAMKSGIYAYILRDIGERYGELLKECEGDRAKLESSIEAWDSAALTL